MRPAIVGVQHLPWLGTGRGVDLGRAAPCPGAQPAPEKRLPRVSCKPSTACCWGRLPAKRCRNPFTVSASLLVQLQRFSLKLSVSAENKALVVLPLEWVRALLESSCCLRVCTKIPRQRLGQKETILVLKKVAKISQQVVLLLRRPGSTLWTCIDIPPCDQTGETGTGWK